MLSSNLHESVMCLTKAQFWINLNFDLTTYIKLKCILKMTESASEVWVRN